MSLGSGEHRVGLPSGRSATRIYQTSGRVPWVRLAGAVVTTVLFLGVAGWLPTAALGAEANLNEQVAAHLEAGEFGAALEAAGNATDEVAKAKLIEQVGQAQLQAGDDSAAVDMARRLPPGDARQRLQQAVSRQPQTAGGGSLANPSQLMMMIQQLTGGPPDSPWMAEDGEGGAMQWNPNGVWVDPNGVLSLLMAKDQQGQLAAMGVKSRSASLNRDMAAASNLRFVSLARLEKAVAARAKAGLPVLETMRHLAGLSRIQYVIAVPEENDVLLAGPAEGWKYNDKGVAVGTTNGQPTLHLDDLVTVLRTFSKNGEKIFGCSINPRPEGMKAAKEFAELSNQAGPLPPGGAAQFTAKLQKQLGLQDVEYYGVPNNSRVARIILAADYRMKLIGIGKLKADQIPSVFDLLLTPKFAKFQTSSSLDALRWWLTMKYESILHSPDRNVYEIRGSSVQVMSEDQIVKKDGTREQTGKASPVNQAFASNFTQHYPELAKQDLVFAELQNVFDMGMVAALLQTEHVADRAQFKLGAFAIDGAYKSQTVTPAKSVDSVVNHRLYNGRNIVVQVAGGVRGDTWNLAKDPELHREASELQSVPAQAKPSKLPADRWWWDAAK